MKRILASFQLEMEKYCIEHPDFRPRVIKTFLSKAEQKLKDRHDGKPEKPPGLVDIVSESELPELVFPCLPRSASVVSNVFLKKLNGYDIGFFFLRNGYSLFTIETLPLLTDLPNIERLGEVSRRWKKLSEDKREAYNLKADEVTFRAYVAIL